MTTLALALMVLIGIAVAFLAGVGVDVALEHIHDELAESCEQYAAANGGGAHGGPGFRHGAEVRRTIARRLRSLRLSEPSKSSEQQ